MCCVDHSTTVEWISGLVISLVSVLLIEGFRRLLWWWRYGHLFGTWRHVHIAETDGDIKYEYVDSANAKYNAIIISANCLAMSLSIRALADENVNGGIAKRAWLGVASMVTPDYGTSNYRYVPDGFKPHWGNHELWVSRIAIPVLISKGGARTDYVGPVIHVRTLDSGSRKDGTGQEARSISLWVKVTDASEVRSFREEVGRRNW